MSKISERSNSLNEIFKALSDPTRRSIIERLSRGELSVTDIAKPLDITLPAVTKHLKVLQKTGLVRQERRAQWRLCFLESAPINEAFDWAGQFRNLWESKLDELEPHVKIPRNKDNTPKGKKKKKKNK